MKLKNKILSLLLGSALATGGLALFDYLNSNKEAQKPKIAEKKFARRGYSGCKEAGKSEKVCNWLYPKAFRYLDYK